MKNFSQDKASIYDYVIEFCLISLLVFTPLFRGGLEVNSFAILQIISAIMAVCWFFKMLSNRKIEFTPNPIYIFILLFLAYTVVQLLPFKILPQTIYFHATKTELLKYIAYALIFLVTLNAINYKEQIKRILSVGIVMGGLMSLFYLFGHLNFNIPYLPSGFVNADHLAGYLGMIFPLGLGLAFASQESSYVDFFSYLSKYTLLFFVTVFIVGVMFLTGCRGGMLAFAGTFFLMIILLVCKQEIRINIFCLFALVFALCVFLFLIGYKPIYDRMLTIQTEFVSDSWAGRMPVWKSMIPMIKDNPVFGSGFGTFNYIYPKYQPLEVMAKHYTHAHNDILQFLQEGGLVGFGILVISIIVAAFYSIYRFFKTSRVWTAGLAIGMFGALLNIFIRSFGDFNLQLPANAVLCVIVLGLFFCVLSFSGLDRRSHKKNIISVKLGVVWITRSSRVMTLCLAGIYIFAVTCPAIANYYYKKGNIEKAIKFDSTNAEYHYALGKKLFKRKRVKDSIPAYQKAVDLNPTNAAYNQSLAWAYGQQKNVEKAVKHFEKAIEFEPENYHRYWVYARYLFKYLRKVENSDLQKRGVELYKKAMQLNPVIEHEALGQYFKIEKNYNKLKQILPATPENYYKVMSKLIDVGLWHKNVDDFMLDMEKMNDEYLCYKVMFRYQEKMGNKDEAMKTLQDYVKIDPNCADAHFLLADRMFYRKPFYEIEFFTHYEKALELDPDNMFYKEWYARHLWHLGQRETAIAALKVVVERMPWNEKLKMLLGKWALEFNDQPPTSNI